MNGPANQAPNPKARWSPRAQRKVGASVRAHEEEEQRKKQMPMMIPSHEQQLEALQRARSSASSSLTSSAATSASSSPMPAEEVDSALQAPELSVFKGFYLGFVPVKLPEPNGPGPRDYDELVEAGMARFFEVYRGKSSQKLRVTMVLAPDAVTVIDSEAVHADLRLPMTQVARLTLACKKGSSKPTASVLLTHNPDRSSAHPLMLHFIKAKTDEQLRFFSSLSNVFNNNIALQLGQIRGWSAEPPARQSPQPQQQKKLQQPSPQQQKKLQPQQQKTVTFAPKEEAAPAPVKASKNEDDDDDTFYGFGTSF